MSDSSGKHYRKVSGKRSSKPGIIVRSKFIKQKPRNDFLLEEFEPLLHGSFDGEGDFPGDERFTKVRQRAAKSSAAEDLEIKKLSINGIDTAVDLANGEQNTDAFLRNDFLILDIKQGDTLQSISLQYHCPVSDLKRANNLISNQEFYALRQLRIPVKKYGLLTERLPPATNIAEPNTKFSSAESECSVHTVNVGIGPISPGGSQEDAVAFFRKMDEDLVKIMENTKSQKDSLEAAAIALTSQSIQPLVMEKAHTGADCGIQWCYLVVIAIMIALILPVGAVIYMYMQHHSENNRGLHHDSFPQAFIPPKS